MRFPSIRQVLHQTGMGKILSVTLFCLYFTFCITLISAFSYPNYAIKYLLTAICPASLFILVLSIARGRLFTTLVVIQAAYLSFINIFLIYHTALNGVPVANEGFFVIFEAFSQENIHENWGWIKSNFSIMGIALIILSISVFIIVTKKSLRYSRQRVNIPFVVSITALLLAVGLYKYKDIAELLSKYQQSAIPIHYVRYQNVIASMKDIKKYTDSIAFTAACRDMDKNPLYIIVIGESATRHHWGLYGYERDTTPLISKKNNVFVFKDAVATSSATLMSLTSSLAVDTADGKKISLADFFVAAGFRTELYSNQPAGGRHDTALGYLFNNIEWKYHASKFGQYAQYDQIIVAKAIDAIKKNDVPTAIFIHLLGSHVDFCDRYPKEFARFTSDDVIRDKPYIPQGKRISAAQRINCYDNSIYYTDHLLDRIIDAAKDSGRYGFVLYFSDHGEENFEFRDHFGRGGLNSTIVYDIPMIIWTSEDFLREHAEMLTPAILRQPVWMKNLLPSLADLAGIRSEHIDISKSFFRPHAAGEVRLCDDKPYESLAGHARMP